MHIPVLLNETIKYLNPQPNQNFVDCTIGGGGHALTILELTKPNGKLLGIDLSTNAIELLNKIKNKNPKIKNRLILICDNFANLKKIVRKENFRHISGILLDLGLSSDILESSQRGFSFRKSEILDMRYNPSKQNLTAKEILNHWPMNKIEYIFLKYGEEKFSKKIAREICKKRKKDKIQTTIDLKNIIESVLEKNKIYNQKLKIKTFARIFQSLRIAVNSELVNLKEVLPQASELLDINGRLGVISYHSLEDRIVKQYFGNFPSLKVLTKKPIRPSEEEIFKNPRSRSAKLRVARKIKI